VTDRGEIVVDAFSGSGTTIMAAERTGRRAYVIELSPHYVDVAIERWQRRTGQAARHEGTGLTFTELADQRRGAATSPADLACADPSSLEEAPSEPVRVRQRSRAA
jgi:hypothetical protein